MRVSILKLWKHTHTKNETKTKRKPILRYNFHLDCFYFLSPPSSLPWSAEFANSSSFFPWLWWLSLHWMYVFNSLISNVNFSLYHLDFSCVYDICIWIRVLDLVLIWVGMSSILFVLFRCELDSAFSVLFLFFLDFFGV